MKKRLFALALVLTVLMAFAACGGTGGSTQQPAEPEKLEGKWKMVGSEDGSVYGEYMKIAPCFFTFGEDGTVTLEFDLSQVSESERSGAEWQANLLSDVAMTYEVLSDTEINLTNSGMGSEHTEKVAYKLEPGKLTFGGAVFERAE